MVVSKGRCTELLRVPGIIKNVEKWSLKAKLFFNHETRSYREFSKQPHIAGSERQRELADKLAASWTTFGFDKVEKPQYQVLLSFPQPNKPNRVTIVESGNVIYDIPGKIKVCRSSFF